MKKAHEVKLERWTYFGAVTVASDIMARMRDVHWMQPKWEKGMRHKIRITVRVEIVEKEPK